MTEIFMPKAGMDMKEGVLVRWLKEIGDPVEKDEPIMEIETDKITMEAEAPASGYFLAKYCEEGDVIPVLDVIGYIGAKDEIPPEKPGGKNQKAEDVKSAPSSNVGPTSPPAQDAHTGNTRATLYARHLAQMRGIDLSTLVPSGKHGEILGRDVLDTGRQPTATPLGQKIASDNGIDIASLQGSGHEGKVRKSDVLAAVSHAPSPSQGGAFLTVESRRPLSGMNRVIAERMFKSHAEIPNVTQSVLVDLTDLLALRAKLNARREQKFSINDFVLKATAVAVKEHPKARTIIQGNEYITYSEANIGFAVNAEDGLFVPVLHHADSLSLPELSARAKDLAMRARNNQIRPDECTGGTFTVSNMGMFDIWDFTPIINQPEAGILGIGAPRDMLQFGSDGSIVSRKICKLFITYDHRIMNGVGAANFELRVRELLEHPEELLLI